MAPTANSISKPLDQSVKTAWHAARRHNTRTLVACAAIVIALLLLTALRPRESIRETSFLAGDSDAFDAAVVRDCGHRLPEVEGRSFTARVKGLDVKFAGWTANESFTAPAVSLRTHEAARLMKKLSRAGTLMDVGANIGKVTLPVLALPSTHTVIAVEPVRANVNALCMAANLNGWLGQPGLVLLRAALSDHSGTAKIFVPDGREDNAALSEQAAVANVHVAEGAEHVALLAGDDVIEHTGKRPDVIKIDTQGHELHVLRGLRKYLLNSTAGKVVVMAESDVKLMRASGVEPGEIWQLMIEELRFEPFCRPDIEVENGLFVVKRGTPISKADYPPGGCQDVFFLKRDTYGAGK